MQKKNNKSAIISLFLIGALLLGVAFAFLTSRDSITNAFTVGSVSIKLSETLWDESAAVNALPGQTLDKNPVITNDGNNDAYVFMKVEIPQESFVATPNGTASYDDLFSLGTIDSDWYELSSNTDKSTHITTKIYVYGTEEAPTSLAKDASTSAIFDTVTVANYYYEENTETSQTNPLAEASETITITGYAIQTTDLDVTTSADIWTLLTNSLVGEATTATKTTTVEAPTETTTVETPTETTTVETPTETPSETTTVTE